MTRERVPWLDPALAAALTALGLLITFDPGNGDGTVIDSFTMPSQAHPSKPRPTRRR